jgi:glycosyltransferase involved in cell wall biosynthesis
MGKRPKLLFISSCIPDPFGTGTEQRAYSFLLAYSKCMDVELWFYPRPENPDVLRLSRIASLCKEAIPFEPTVVQQENEPINKRLNRSLRSTDYVHVTQLLFTLRHPRIFWDIDELPWVVGDPGRAKIMVQEAREKADKLWELYKGFSKRCSLIFASSSREAHADIGKISVIPNCYPSNGPVERGADNSKTLLFVGSLGYPPNVDAVAYFLRSIRPLLPATVKFRVVGRRPAGPKYRKMFDDWSRSGRIEAFYDVESCSPHYAVAAAAVVPLAFGGGTRLKILEAFAHGCPVVSTSKGCEGLQVNNNVELLIGDDRASFAGACERLLSSKALGERLSGTALEFVQKNHSQDVVERTLYAALANVGVTIAA